MTTLQRMPLSLTEIKRRREAQGLTMDEAATRAQAILRTFGKKTVKFTRQRWYEIESGTIKNPTIQVVESLAGALGCGVDDLLTSGGRIKL